MANAELIKTYRNCAIDFFLLHSNISAFDRGLQNDTMEINNKKREHQIQTKHPTHYNPFASTEHVNCDNVK